MNQSGNGSLHIGHITYSFDDIAQGIYEIKALKKNEIRALNFCKEWLKGIQSFEVRTSGSTGTPKVISISREQFIYSAKTTVKALDLDNGCSSLICINTSYIGGLMMLIRGLEFDMQMTLVEPKSNPFLSLNTSQNFDFIALAPLQLETIFSNNLDERINNSKAIILGGAAINKQLRSQSETLKAPIYETYGMTETVSHIALKRINGHQKSNFFETIGDSKISLSSKGCLEIFGTITNKKLLVTNDIVELHSSTQFKWIGRIDNVINSGGVKINIEIIESLIDPIFKDLGLNFVVSSTADERLGEKLVLLIESKSFEVDKHTKLIAQIKNELEPYWYPKKIQYVDKLFFTNAGKIDRLVNKSLISDS